MSLSTKGNPCGHLWFPQPYLTLPKHLQSKSFAPPPWNQHINYICKPMWTKLCTHPQRSRATLPKPLWRISTNVVQSRCIALQTVFSTKRLSTRGKKPMWPFVVSASLPKYSQTISGQKPFPRPLRFQHIKF